MSRACNVARLLFRAGQTLQIKFKSRAFAVLCGAREIHITERDIHEPHCRIFSDLSTNHESLKRHPCERLTKTLSCAASVRQTSRFFRGSRMSKRSALSRYIRNIYSLTIFYVREVRKVPRIARIASTVLRRKKSDAKLIEMHTLQRHAIFDLECRESGSLLFLPRAPRARYLSISRRCV